MANKEAPPASTERGQWSKYTDGEWWKLIRGTDWDGPEASSRAEAARQWAQRNGWSAERRCIGTEVLYIRFVPARKGR